MGQTFSSISSFHTWIREPIQSKSSTIHEKGETTSSALDVKAQSGSSTGSQIVCEKGKSKKTTTIHDNLLANPTLEDFAIKFEQHIRCSERNKTIQILKQLDYKVFQNPEIPNSTARYVQENVESFIDLIVINLRVLNSRWKFKIVKSGSFYDGLRVGLPFEFDFMLEFEDISSPLVIKKSKINEFDIYSSEPSMVFKDPPGNIKINGTGNLNLFQNSSDDMLDESIEGITDYRVRSYNLRYTLYTDLLTVIGQIKSHKHLKVLDIKYVQDFKPNFCLWLEMDGYGIMIDLVPCLKFPISYYEFLPEIEQLSLEALMNIIPESESNTLEFISSNLYLVCTNTKWRISYSILEQKLMQHIPDDFKITLRLLKYFLNIMFIHDKPVADQIRDMNYSESDPEINNEQNSDSVVCYDKNHTESDMHSSVVKIMGNNAVIKGTFPATIDKRVDAGMNIFGYKSYFKSYPIKCLFLDIMQDIYTIDSKKYSLYKDDPLSLLFAMLYRLSFIYIEKTNENYLILRHKVSFFGNFFNCMFSHLSESDCHNFLAVIGEMLIQAEVDQNLDMFPMLNYPKVPGAKFVNI